MLFLVRGEILNCFLQSLVRKRFFWVSRRFGERKVCQLFLWYQNSSREDYVPKKRKREMWLRIKPKSISCGSFNKSFKSDWPSAELYFREVPIKFPWQRRMNTSKGCKFERFGRFAQRQKTKFSTLKIGCFRYFVESTINSWLHGIRNLSIAL